MATKWKKPTWNPVGVLVRVSVDKKYRIEKRHYDIPSCHVEYVLIDLETGEKSAHDSLADAKEAVQR